MKQLSAVYCVQLSLTQGQKELENSARRFILGSTMLRKSAFRILAFNWARTLATTSSRKICNCHTHQAGYKLIRFIIPVKNGRLPWKSVFEIQGSKTWWKMHTSLNYINLKRKIVLRRFSKYEENKKFQNQQQKCFLFLFIYIFLIFCSVFFFMFLPLFIC